MQHNAEKLLNKKNIKIQILLNCQTVSQLIVWSLLQLFVADHRAWHAEGQRAVGVTSMSEPEEEDDDYDAAGKPNSRCRSWFLSGRTSHRPIRYDARLSRHSSSLAGDDCVRMPTAVRLCDTDSDFLICPSCLTCWLDLEHGAHEAGRGITSLSWSLFTLSQRPLCVRVFTNQQ